MKISDRIVSKSLQNETILLDTQSGEYFSTNESAGKIMNLLKQELPREEIIQRFAEEYNIDSSQAAQDVEEFIKNLKSSRIVE